jgi:tetratricopeptide (TPR) repeat protein
MRRSIVLAAMLTSLVAWPGFAGETPNLGESPAWSINFSPERLVVSVSPTRQTLQIGGSAATLLGAGVDSVVNDRYRQDLEEAIGDYDPLRVLEGALESGLNTASGSSVQRVSPMGTAARYTSVREAEEARLAKLNGEGRDFVIDLKGLAGVFTEDALLVIKISGEAFDTGSTKRVWNDTVLFTAEPALISNKPGDPTQRLMARVTSPKLTTEEDRLQRWLKNDGAEFRQEFDRGAEMTVAGLLQGLGIEESVEGTLVLARTALETKDQKRALALFEKAIEDGDRSEVALNGRVVALARNKQVDEAVAAGRDLTTVYPEYGPGWLNLAWLLAVEKNDAKSARPAYERALELGMAPVKKIDKKLK